MDTNYESLLKSGCKCECGAINTTIYSTYIYSNTLYRLRRQDTEDTWAQHPTQNNF